MRLIPKVDIFGVGISVTDYEKASDAVISAARERKSFAVTALAVHGLIEAVLDQEFLSLVNKIDLVTPDGQPVRWAMNLLAKADLKERVAGIDLTDAVCRKAQSEGISIGLFGSTEETINKFSKALERNYPGINIVYIQSDRFRDPTPQEDREDIERINASGAGIVLVGRGCPRQERWVAEHRGKINAAMIGVGAVFDFMAGTLTRAPVWMQKRGLEWLYRLAVDPRRLFRRYLVTNTLFCWYLAVEYLRGYLPGDKRGL